jgi:hypothetical protein
VTGLARVPVCHGDAQAGAGDEDMLIDRWGEDSAQCAHAQCLEQCVRVWYPEVGVRGPRFWWT